MDKQIFELAELLGHTLIDNGLKIATAESCTGGGIAQAITEISGSSAWFDRGFVTYSNLSKVQMLQVNQQTLEQYGAVSNQVAIQMVEGALIGSDANIAVAVTGIAGPDGGTEGKPVGTVYIAWGVKGGEIKCTKQLFSGNRTDIRQQTVIYSLKSIIELVAVTVNPASCDNMLKFS